MREGLQVRVSKWVMVTLVLALGAANPVARAGDAPKIGTVDMQLALQSVEAGKKAKAKLEGEFNAKKQQLQKEEAQIKKMGDEFKKQSLVMSDQARAKKQAEIQDRILKFQELTAQSQAEIQQKESELTAPIIDALRKIVSDVAQKKGYTLVLEKNENTVLYSQDKDDLTQQVISAYNKAHKG